MDGLDLFFSKLRWSSLCLFLLLPHFYWITLIPCCLCQNVILNEETTPQHTLYTTSHVHHQQEHLQHHHNLNHHQEQKHRHNNLSHKLSNKQAENDKVQRTVHMQVLLHRQQQGERNHQQRQEQIQHLHHRTRSLKRRDAYNTNARLRMPYIMDHPEDVTVQKHQPTTLNCKADGNPTPKIEWFKDGKKVNNTGNRMVLPSGSLFFLHVMQNKDTGVYWCTANNELGSVTSQKAILSLPTKHPRIHKPHPGAVVTPTVQEVSSSTVDSGLEEESERANGTGEEDEELYPPQPPLTGKQSKGPGAGGHDGHDGHHHHHYSRDPLKEPWFIIVAALTVMFILSSGVLIFLMRQRSASSNSKTPVVQHISVSLPNDLGGGSMAGKASSLVHEPVWIDHSWFSGGSNGNNSITGIAPGLAMVGSGSRVPSSSSKLIREMGCGTGSSTLEDTYSVIEANDYAEVADVQNLTTFKRNNNNANANANGQQGAANALLHRSNSPGPYATTNLINITPNALYRVANEGGGYRGLNPLVDHLSTFGQLAPHLQGQANGGGSGNSSVPRKQNSSQPPQQQSQLPSSPYHKLRNGLGCE